MGDSPAEFPAPTQGTVSSKISYHCVFLFMYNAEVEFPFSCVKLKDLVNTSFPFNLVEGSLDDESRKTPFNLFGTQQYCLFAKVQDGKK